MRLLLVFGFIIISVSSCAKKKEEPQFDRAKQFTKELAQLKDYFQIPGLAVSIEKDDEIIYKNYSGYADLKLQTELDSTHIFPIASLTKVFSGVLIMKLVEQGKVSLDEPIKTYVPQMNPSDSILVKHILSHTSQGDIGKKFYYSSRFGILTNVIEKASGLSFKEYMDSEIFQPLGLKNTHLLKDSLQVVQNNLNIAKPYRIENGVEPGFIDYGFSSSAGIVSDLNDLSTFNQALDRNTLITEKSKNLIFTGVDKSLPYGFGIFSQEFQGLELVWAYGQYDCYSSLLLKVPSKKLTLTMLANNNLLSDPARLIYGDATSSLFVLSFLKNYVYSLDDMNLLETKESIKNKEQYVNQDFYREKLLAQALAESFMARFDVKKMKTSVELLNTVFSEFPNYLEYTDLTVLHNLTFLKDIAFHMKLGEFNEFDEKIEAISTKLLKEDPQNPYLNVYMGIYHDRKGDNDKAKYYFERIVKSNNFSKNWYTAEAENWIKGQEN